MGLKGPNGQQVLKDSKAEVPLTQEGDPLPGWVCPGIACVIDFLPDSGV